MKKILFSSDLHLLNSEVDAFLKHGAVPEKLAKLLSILEREHPDGLILTGDLLSGERLQEEYGLLDRLLVSFPKMDVFLTLGNHEIWGRTLEEAKEVLLSFPRRERFHFLDVCGGVEWGEDLLVVGGALLFDGSMRIWENQKISPWNGWQDWRISVIEQNFSKWSKGYIEDFSRAIKEKGKGRTVILCTHSLPSEKLNGHEPSVYSFYSGVKDILPFLNLDKEKKHWCLCGHTHREKMCDLAEGVYGVNVGSDYDDFRSLILNI